MGSFERSVRRAGCALWLLAAASAGAQAPEGAPGLPAVQAASPASLEELRARFDRARVDGDEAGRAKALSDLRSLLEGIADPELRRKAGREFFGGGEQGRGERAERRRRDRELDERLSGLSAEERDRVLGERFAGDPEGLELYGKRRAIRELRERFRTSSDPSERQALRERFFREHPDARLFFGAEGSKEGGDRVRPRKDGAR